ncbi:uncharacterized protein [Palaemon carinicauda]|uniref:uncharacterized protein n=1 Tax=Palaemon carinicauda TaxID=392227 RepID=UPI0035B60C00
MLYGTETASLRKTDEKKMDVAEMRILRWMSGMTRKDIIKNDEFRGSTNVLEISKKVQEGRMRWYGHVGRHTMENKVHGRRRGRLRRDCIRKDLREKGNDEAEAQDKNRWKRLIRNATPNRNENKPKKKTLRD